MSLEGGVVRGMLGTQHNPAPADLSRSKPCSRPFLISNIMGLEERGQVAPPSPAPAGPEDEGEGGVSPGGSPGPDSDSELMGDEDSLAKVTYICIMYIIKKNTYILLSFLALKIHVLHLALAKKFIQQYFFLGFASCGHHWDLY